VSGIEVFGYVMLGLIVIVGACVVAASASGLALHLAGKTIRNVEVLDDFMSWRRARRKMERHLA
jgi:hypothetical protein